jgi:predicted signal transduction protein with EAL and GGDEF domain
MSIGIAKYPEDAKTYNELLQIADVAMYNVKNNKKGSYIL